MNLRSKLSLLTVSALIFAAMSGVPGVARADSELPTNGAIAYGKYIHDSNDMFTYDYELHLIEQGYDIATGIKSYGPIMMEWSPDGAKLAFSARLNAESAKLYSINADATNYIQLTEYDGDYPTWSPDGTKIAFVSENISAEYGIDVINPDGSGKTRIWTGEASRLDWSPDGQRIFFKCGGGVASINADGTDYQVLASDSQSLFGSPSAYIDGSLIVYGGSVKSVETGLYGLGDLYSMLPDGTDQTNITGTEDIGEYFPNWSPDGNELYYLEEEAAASKLVKIDMTEMVKYEVLSGVKISDYDVQPVYGDPILWPIETPTPSPSSTPTPSTDPTPSPSQSPAPEGTLFDVHRFWSPIFNNAHFFTMDGNEASHVRAHDRNWTYEGVAFRAYAPVNGSDCGERAQVYRFWSPVFRSHFYTADLNERNRLVGFDRNWNYEGTAYCADNSQKQDEVPLHRFWSSRFGKHFFTADQAEKDRIVAKDRNWSYEGVAYFVRR